MGGYKKYFLHIDVNANKLIAAFLWPTMPDEKARWNINNIYQLKNGDIWVATSNNRIYVFDIVKSSFKEKFGPHCKHQLQNKVEVFLELPDDIRFSLGTYASGLACYFTKLDSFIFSQTPNRLSAHKYLQLLLIPIMDYG